jgi:hypothetical protein
MKSLGEDWGDAPGTCEQCGRELDQNDETLECNCGAVLCPLCYGNHTECDII